MSLQGHPYQQIFITAGKVAYTGGLAAGLVIGLRRRAGGVEHGMVAVDIVDVRAGVFLRLAHGDLLPGHQLGNLRQGIIEVAGGDRFHRADDDAGRFVARIYAMGAEVALGRRVGFGIDVKGIVGAGLHARFAADTAVAVKIDNAVIPDVKRGGGADVHARSGLAMIAAVHRKDPPVVGEGALLHIFHMGSVDPQRHVVLRLAGHRAGMAPDAGAVVDYEAVIHSVRACIIFLMSPGVAMILVKVPMVRSG